MGWLQSRRSAAGRATDALSAATNHDANSKQINYEPKRTLIPWPFFRPLPSATLPRSVLRQRN